MCSEGVENRIKNTIFPLAPQHHVREEIFHHVKRFERLDEATAPDGTVLKLFRHDGAYLIRAGGIELMSSRHHLSEDRLAELVCNPLREQPAVRVLIGGLGLGFTLKAALGDLKSDATVDVAEFLAAVIEWNRKPEYGISTEALNDPRVNVIHDDVVHVLSRSPGLYDGIMLDIDNGAEPIVTLGNADLYNGGGIRTALAALRPGGRISYWSVDADPAFEAALRHTGLPVEVEAVRTHPSGGASHFIYVVQQRGNSAE